CSRSRHRRHPTSTLFPYTTLFRSHRDGIKLAAYASANPAGPFGWAVAQHHPEWFLDANGQLPQLTAADVEALDRWNDPRWRQSRSEEHTSELQSLAYLVCRLLLEK